MNFLTRAMLAVTRMKVRTIILLVILVAIASMVLTGLSIQHATSLASTLARQKLGAQLTLGYNMQNALEKARVAGEQGGQRPGIQSQPVTEEMAQEIASHENIVAFNYLVNTSGMADDFEPVSTEEESGVQQDNNANRNPELIFGGFAPVARVIPDVTVTGVVSTEMMDAFHNDQAKLVEGRHLTKEDSGKKVAVIEKNLALENGLKVGDTVSIKATRADDTIGFSIVGIYESSMDSSTEGGMMGNFPFTQPYNLIYVDYTSALPLKSVLTGTGVVSGGIDMAVFYVDDPKNIDQVLADAKSMSIDWENFTLDANDLAYQRMMGPIENVASFSKIVVYLVAIAGALIITLILMLSVKDRMYETGVLLSMGEGKEKIIAQYLAEVLIIAIVAFGLSIFSGKFIAQGMGNMLLERELQVEQTQGLSNQGAGFPGGFSPRSGGQFGRFGGQMFQIGANGAIEPIESLDVQITKSEVGQMSAAGLLIVIIGTILPAATIMLYKPKTILIKAS